MVNGLGGALKSIGERLSAVGAAGQDPSAFFQRLQQQKLLEQERARKEAQQAQQQQALEQLQSILAGNSIPEFRKRELGSPQAIEAERQRNLLSVLGTLAPGQLAQQGISQAFPQAPTPVSPLGKLQQDIAGGLVPRGIGQQAIQKAISPRQPLVSITQQTETARQRARAEASEKRLSGIIDKTFNDLEQLENTVIPLAGIKQNLQALAVKGEVTGPASGFLTTLQSFGNQLGLKVDIDQASSIEQIQGFANKLAIPLAKSLGVNPTDRDIKIIQSTIANIGKTPESNFTFVDVAEQILARKRKEAGLVNDLIERDELNESQVRRRLTEFRRDNQVRIPRKIPFRRERLIVNERYVTPQGVGLWDGQGFVIQ